MDVRGCPGERGRPRAHHLLSETLNQEISEQLDKPRSAKRTPVDIAIPALILALSVPVGMPMAARARSADELKPVALLLRVLPDGVATYRRHIEIRIRAGNIVLR